MKYQILMLLVFLFGCGQSNHQTEKKENEDLSIRINKPITFNSDEDINISLPQISDTIVLNTINKHTRSNLLGVLFETNKIYVVVGIVPSDSGSPLIVTTDKKGNKIDDYYVYETAGADMGYYSTNIVTIFPDRTIVFADSILTRKINDDGDDEIPGTDSISVVTKHYKIIDSGKIERTN